MENKAPTTADKEAAKQLAEEEQALNLMMQRLKLLHIKAPDVMYAAFMKAVNDAQAKITDFTNLMRDETSSEAFARAKKSREERPLGITPWRHGDYPGWFDLDKPWTA
ncbi:hypothetical protein THAR02_11452 [Trichoderma harzianum]|uniref:Uncharacterized protein n=1 Tax=Trichoderma harzianum TaxID=5544 RepID=A0A0F9ZTL0_TRIHA|nr:hypothetical protein THAR02_11452 [Trichoderma harzianum]